MKNKIIGFLSLGAAAASVLAACSSSSSGGGSAADVCSDYATAYLAYVEKCQGGLDPAKLDDFSTRYATLCKSELTLKGIPDLTGDLSSCAASIKGASCSTQVSQIAACQFDGKVGSLGNGEACTDDLQCSSGSCVTNKSTGDSGTSSDCGTCTAAVADGGDCSEGACVQGDECSVALSADGSSIEYTCKAKGTPGDVGATCDDSAGCKAPNHCGFDDSGNGTCAAPVASGGSCEDTSECAEGLSCIGTTGADGSPTQTCGAPVKVGAACVGGDCEIGSTCDTTSKTCVKYTFAAAGAACDGSSILCSDGQCVTSSDGDGTGGTTTGTCPTIIPDGQACDDSGDNSSQCDFEAQCTAGKCTLAVAVCN